MTFSYKIWFSKRISKNNNKNTKYKIHTIRKDIKNLKYVKTIKMYKISIEIHLNYKFKKITFKKYLYSRIV